MPGPNLVQWTSCPISRSPLFSLVSPENF